MSSGSMNTRWDFNCALGTSFRRLHNSLLKACALLYLIPEGQSNWPHYRHFSEVLESDSKVAFTRENWAAFNLGRGKQKGTTGSQPKPICPFHGKGKMAACKIGLVRLCEVGQGETKRKRGATNRRGQKINEEERAEFSGFTLCSIEVADDSRLDGTAFINFKWAESSYDIGKLFVRPTFHTLFTSCFLCLG